MEQDIFRRPIKRKKPPSGARLLASKLVPFREDLQARVIEEISAEALARTGARSIQELIAGTQVAGKIARRMRLQTVPRPTVETPRRIAMMKAEAQQMATLEELPSSVQTAIRSIYRTITEIQRAILPLALQVELRARERQIAELDRRVETLKAVCAQLGVDIKTAPVAQALDAAAQLRRQLLDRILTIKQHIEEAERRRREVKLQVGEAQSQSETQ